MYPRRQRLRSWQVRELLGEEAYAHWDSRRLIRVNNSLWGFRCLIIDTNRSCRSRSREPINRYPSEDWIWLVTRNISPEMRLTFVISPRVWVGPVDKFFIDPGQQTNWTVGQRVSNRLRTGTLLVKVTLPIISEPHISLETGLLGSWEGCHQKKEEAEGILEHAGRLCTWSHGFSCVLSIMK